MSTATEIQSNSQRSLVGTKHAVVKRWRIPSWNINPDYALRFTLRESNKVIDASLAAASNFVGRVFFRATGSGWGRLTTSGKMAAIACFLMFCVILWISG